MYPKEVPMRTWRVIFFLALLIPDAARQSYAQDGFQNLTDVVAVRVESDVVVFLADGERGLYKTDWTRRAQPALTLSRQFISLEDEYPVKKPVALARVRTDLYVLDSVGPRVFVFRVTGAGGLDAPRIITLPEGSTPSTMAVSSERQLFIGDRAQRRITIISEDGARVHTLEGVTPDSMWCVDNRLEVFDRTEGRIYRVNSALSDATAGRSQPIELREHPLFQGAQIRARLAQTSRVASYGRIYYLASER